MVLPDRLFVRLALRENTDCQKLPIQVTMHIRMELLGFLLFCNVIYSNVANNYKINISASVSIELRRADRLQNYQAKTGIKAKKNLTYYVDLFTKTSPYAFVIHLKTLYAEYFVTSFNSLEHLEKNCSIVW